MTETFTNQFRNAQSNAVFDRLFQSLLIVSDARVVCIAGQLWDKPSSDRQAALHNIRSWWARETSSRASKETLNKLKEFARWAIEDGREACCDLDSDDIHDKALSLGLIVERIATAEDAEAFVDVEEGQTFFRLASWLEDEPSHPNQSRHSRAQAEQQNEPTGSRDERRNYAGAAQK